MNQKFKEQGGIATMDPSNFRRWLMSKIVSRIASPQRLVAQRKKAEKHRIKNGLAHEIEYFHQIEDAYGHLVAQVIQTLAERYDIKLRCHLVEGPQGLNSAEPDLLLRLAQYDSGLVASDYGLDFPAIDEPPSAELFKLAKSILASLDSAAFVENISELSHALWTHDKNALLELAERLGQSSDAETNAAIMRGMQRRELLKHYSGAMFYYLGEWYWGVDRLYHLEQRLQELGVDKMMGHEMIMPRPSVEMGPLKDEGKITLEVYPSLRSPYTAICFDQVLKLVEETGINLVTKPVLPMVMRGVPATREKGKYIFTDTLREARAQSIPYGNFFDPIGNPVRRCYSIYPWAVAQGRGNELLSAFLAAAFAEGINTNNDKGLRHVVEKAGLDWHSAKEHLGDTAWEDELESNRQSMYDVGLWGVPSFRLLDENGEQVLALWGQDRLWLISRAIQNLLKKNH